MSRVLPYRVGEQTTLLSPEQLQPWRWHWRGLPSFSHADKTAAESVLVNFESSADREAFAELIGQTVTERTQSVWYPAADIGRYANKRYICVETE